MPLTRRLSGSDGLVRMLLVHEGGAAWLNEGGERVKVRRRMQIGISVERQRGSLLRRLDPSAWDSAVDARSWLSGRWRNRRNQRILF